MTMGMILHDWNLERKQHLIRAAYEALPPGGTLVAIENLIDDARRENAFGMMMSLNMLIEFGDAFDFTGADFSGTGVAKPGSSARWKWCTWRAPAALPSPTSSAGLRRATKNPIQRDAQREEHRAEAKTKRLSVDAPGHGDVFDREAERVDENDLVRSRASGAGTDHQLPELAIDSRA